MSGNKKVSLSTTVAGVSLSSCVYNASGPRTGSSAAMSKIALSKAGGVLAKSATLESQTGNDLPRCWHSADENASMNSEGLPNAGIDYYVSSSTISETIGESQKAYMVSISGKTLDDNLEMLRRIASSNSKGEIAAVELNLACPNIIGKPIIAYDFEQMESVLKAVSDLAEKVSLPPLGVKLPPYLDGPHFARAASVLNKYAHVVKYAASINTIGNALAIDIHAEMPAIRPKGGFAGLSGKAVKYTALANVQKMRELLSQEIDVVGVGGVSSGEDVFEMILCGATAVQVGTCHWTEGPKCFDRICSELTTLMEEKGYTSISDFRNKLKPWSKEGASLSRQKKSQLKNQSNTKTMTESTIHNIGFVYQLLSSVLMVFVAVLLADKFQVIQM